MIGADKSEIALLGPTSLGLSLFANGITWREGDEVVCYQDDYPANVYPWMALASQGVKVRQVRPEKPGRITPEVVERELSSRTRLVALASCHYLSGWRIDVDAIGALLHERGVLFSVDAIQTLGAFPFSARFVDFLSADAHKWMLGRWRSASFTWLSEISSCAVRRFSDRGTSFHRNFLRRRR